MRLDMPEACGAFSQSEQAMSLVSPHVPEDPFRDAEVNEERFGRSQKALIQNRRANKKHRKRGAPFIQRKISRTIRNPPVCAEVRFQVRPFGCYPACDHSSTACIRPILAEAQVVYFLALHPRWPKH